MNAYYTNQYISTTLATVGGIDNSQTTGIIIASVTNIETAKPGIACLSYTDPIDTSKAEWITYTSIDSVTKEFQGVTRGQEGYGAKPHDNGVTIAFPLSKSHINNLNDALIIDGVETNMVTGVVSASGISLNPATELVTKSYVDGGLKDSLARQAIINSACQINQIVTPVNLTTGKLYGTDTFYAKGAGTAVSAGTISNTASPALTTAFADKLAGVTLTGTGIVYGYRNIDSANAIHYKNKTASFSVLVRHDVGSAINYTIKINKANSADNFSAVTNIATGSAKSVVTGTDTLLKLENVSMGDCSNGIEIEIIAECGAITTKNFEFSEWQFNLGSVVLPFMAKNYQEDLIDCKRYYQRIVATIAYGVSGITGRATSNTNLYGQILLPVTMRTKPLLERSGTWQVWGASAAQITGATSDGGNQNILVSIISSGMTTNGFYMVIADNDANAYWGFNARPAIA